MADNDTNEPSGDEMTAKLLQFHEITRIEDLDRCKTILSEHNWNVELAVQSTFNDTPVSQPSTSEAQAHVSPAVSASSVRRRPISPRQSLLHEHRFVPRQMVYVGNNSRSMPSGVLGWSYYFLAFPFRFTIGNIFSILKFIYRLFFPDPRELVTDPYGDVISFISEFEIKYPNHPTFYRDTYGKAQAEAKREIRFLLIYLHDPKSEDTDSFCSGTLCNPEVIDFLNQRVILWACSVEKPEGYKVTKIIRYPTYPLLALVCLYHNQMAVVGRIQGAVTPEELIGRLTEMINVYEPELISARADRDARSENQLIRQEQDEAYLISLQKDKEKMAQKKREKEEEVRMQEKKELEEREKEMHKEKCLERKERCKKELPPEPDKSVSDVYVLVIKLPDGTRLQRKFQVTDTVKTLHDYIYAQDGAPTKFQVFSNFPRRQLTGCCTEAVDSSNDHFPSLKDLGLNRSDTLFVQATFSDDEDSD